MNDLSFRRMNGELGFRRGRLGAMRMGFQRGVRADAPAWRTTAAMVLVAVFALSCTAGQTERGAVPSPTQVPNTPSEGFWFGDFKVGMPLAEGQLGSFGSLVARNETGAALTLVSVEPLRVHGLAVEEMKTQVWTDADQQAGRVTQVGTTDTYPPPGDLGEVAGTVVPVGSSVGVTFAVRRVANSGVPAPSFDEVKITYRQSGRTYVTIADAALELVPPP